MERKLIRQGIGGYTIYLPKKWIDQKGLSEKDSVELKELGQDLVIRSNKKQRTRCLIDVKGTSDFDLRNNLTHAYRAGHDQILFRNLDESSFEFVKKFVSELLMGFEITEIKENSCLIENISEPSEEKYDVLIRRIFLINKEYYGVLKKCVSETSYSSDKVVAELRVQQDKLILLCKRLLIKNRLETDPVLDWELLTFLMHIGHNLFYLYDEAKIHKLKLKKDTLDVLEKAEEYYCLLYDAYFKKDSKKIDEINRLKNKYQSDLIKDLFKKEIVSNHVFISLLRENFRLVQIGSSPVLSQLVSLKEIHNL